MRIGLFDLDGTITRHDTLVPYVFGFCLRRPLRLLGWLTMPWAVLRYAFGGRDRGELKQALIQATLKGVSRADIARWNERWAPKLIARALQPEALRRIREHRDNGDYLVLMSASPDLYVPAIARALGMNETICTGVRWDGMQLNGELTTENRRGEEKVRCLQALRQRHPDAFITGYGNSDSDLPHLKLCDRAHLVNAPQNAVKAAAQTSVQIGWSL